MVVDKGGTCVVVVEMIFDARAGVGVRLLKIYLVLEFAHAIWIGVSGSLSSEPTLRRRPTPSFLLSTYVLH